MSSEIRQTVDDIFHVACDLPPQERVSYLDQACAGKAELRREIDDLLAHYSADDTFLERPALHDAARRLANEKSLFETRPDSQSGVFSDTLQALRGGAWMIGAYRVIDQIGKGGMGVVYLAEDTERRRQVAIKVLLKDFLLDEDRVARFNREARMLEELKSLKHPNIAEIYEQTESEGKPCLVLEYVPGETLSDCISRGPLPLAEALRIGLQIADALASAHQQHIVHRDLKPANIKITPRGEVKVLDFGLAKRFYPEFQDEEAGDFQTRSLSLTESGMLIGTPAYMSPEQWNSKPTDQRADLWAFGCVLFEMLTGQPPFARKTRAETMKAVFDGAPDWNALPASTPLVVQDLLRRCLQKDPQLRLPDAEEAQQALAEALGQKRFALRLWLKSWAWMIDRQAIIAFSSIALVLGGFLIWKYTPMSGLTLRKPLSIDSNDDLTKLFKQEFGDADVTFLKAAINKQQQTSINLLSEEQAKQLRQNQDYKDGINEIIDQLKKEISEGQKTAQRYAILAQAYLFKYFLTEDGKDKDEAVSAAEAAKNLAPESLEVLIALGNVFNTLGWSKDAIRTFEKANEQQPNHPDILFGLGLAHELGGDEKELAEGYHRQAIEARKEREGRYFWDDYNELGAFYFGRNQYEQAVLAWTRVTELEPLNPTGYSNLGEALIAQGCVEEAITAFNNSIRVRGTAVAYSNLGAAYLFAGRHVEAVNILETLTRKGFVEDAEFEEAWLNLGDAYRYTGQKDQAAAAYLKALELVKNHLDRHSNDAGATVLKAELIAKLNSLGQFVSQENPVELIKKVPESEVGMTGAVIYSLSNDRVKALAFAKQAVDDGSSKFLLLNHPDLSDLKNEQVFREMAAQYRPACN